MKDEDDASESSTISSHPERVEHPSNISVQRGRSCTGCLYHSSYRKENGRNPLCVGFSRSEKQVYSVVGDPEWEGKRLLEFKYACLGYSIYKQSTKNANQEKQVDLPACLGIELQLLDPRKAPQNHPVSAQSPVTAQSDVHEEGPPILPRPPSSTPRPPIGGGIRSDEFATRFFRTAGLIATACGNNLSRVAGSIKTGIDDILYPDRRRPK